MELLRVSYSSPEHPKKLPEQEFVVSGILEENTRWVNLQFNYVLFHDGSKIDGINNTLPLSLSFLGTDKVAGLKRGDFYLFSNYHTYCLNHSSCQTLFGLPLHEQSMDRDVSKLVENGELISRMLLQSQVPPHLDSHWLLNALKTNNLSKVVDQPYVLRHPYNLRVSVDVR